MVEREDLGSEGWVLELIIKVFEHKGQGSHPAHGERRISRKDINRK